MMTVPLHTAAAAGDKPLLCVARLMHAKGAAAEKKGDEWRTDCY